MSAAAATLRSSRAPWFSLNARNLAASLSARTRGRLPFVDLGGHCAFGMHNWHLPGRGRGSQPRAGETTPPQPRLPRQRRHLDHPPRRTLRLHAPGPPPLRRRPGPRPASNDAPPLRRLNANGCRSPNRRAELRPTPGHRLKNDRKRSPEHRRPPRKPDDSTPQQPRYCQPGHPEAQPCLQDDFGMVLAGQLSSLTSEGAPRMVC